MNQNYFEFITSYLLKRYINNDIESMCGKNLILYNNLLSGFKKTIFFGNFGNISFGIPLDEK